MHFKSFWRKFRLKKKLKRSKNYGIIIIEKEKKICILDDFSVGSYIKLFTEATNISIPR